MSFLFHAGGMSRLRLNRGLRTNLEKYSKSQNKIVYFAKKKVEVGLSLVYFLVNDHWFATSVILVLWAFNHIHSDWSEVKHMLHSQRLNHMPLVLVMYATTVSLTALITLGCKLACSPSEGSSDRTTHWPSRDDCNLFMADGGWTLSFIRVSRGEKFVERIFFKGAGD